jgi:hypothetical protein
MTQTEYKQYEVQIMSLISYFSFRISKHGLKELVTEKTTSGYPKILALGICYHATDQIMICKVGNWKLRLLHELGHEFKMGHVMDDGKAMHPWGYKRGWRISIDEADESKIEGLKNRFTGITGLPCPIVYSAE